MACVGDVLKTRRSKCVCGSNLEVKRRGNRETTLTVYTSTGTRTYFHEESRKKYY